MLEITGTVEKRKMKEQLLDRMDLERERGITIKLQPVNMEYEGYHLNLIDTPGHVDFSYEVSRSLAAVEGAVLLVDATQGIQAQTLANLYLALDQNLEIVPVVNKIDLPAADVKGTKESIVKLLGCKQEEILEASGKTGAGVKEILQAVIDCVPPPKTTAENKLRALIFDSVYDEYKGVVAYVRLVDGEVKKGDEIKMVTTKYESDALDVGVFKPDYKSTGELRTGEIGYIVTGLKSVEECKVGDTITLSNALIASPSLSEGTGVVMKNKNHTPPTPPSSKGGRVRAMVVALPGYKEVKPMVFAGIFCKEGNEYEELREGIGKLKLTDSALVYEPEHSQALGFGFRCGFLGLLHLEIFQERLRREYGLGLVVTTPSVAYQLKKTGGEEMIVRSALDMPDPAHIASIKEPWVTLDVISPKDYMGGIMSLVQEKRGTYKNTEYIDDNRVILHYEMPMSTILTDFYDKVKSATSGYASINYEFLDYRNCEVQRLDILVAEEQVESLATIVYKDEAFKRGKEIVNSLKNTLPRQQFVLKIQAAIGGKVIAAERVSALRKDVTAKLYGGDVSRKRKLLEKQKKGKKKMMSMGKGKVDIPPEAFLAVLKK
jgi:GTP-binding protein LepA